MAQASTSSRTITVTPTITAGAYSANDAVGGLMTFLGLFKKQGSGMLVSLVLTDQEEQNAVTDIILFKQTFTATADNAAINISAADSLNIIGTFRVGSGDYIDVGAATVATLSNIGKILRVADQETLFAQMVHTHI